jgi:hypothetical protein
MMQKTLTVGNARDAGKNVLSFSFFIALAQTLFLGLGVLMYLFAVGKGIPLATGEGKFLHTDDLYPLLTLHYFGATGAIAFLIAVIASTFASIDACITALTTALSSFPSGTARALLSTLYSGLRATPTDPCLACICSGFFPGCGFGKGWRRRPACPPHC